jgi:hypothetical protein
MPPKSLKEFTEDLSAHIRARYSLISIQTSEEERALRVIDSICEARKSGLYVWSRTQGIVRSTASLPDLVDPLGVLKWYEAQTEKSLLVLKDFHPYLKEPSVVRKLRDLGQSLKRQTKNILFLSPSFAVPNDLQKEIALIDLPLPTRDEIRPLVDRAATALGEECVADSAREAVVDAAGGLTLEEVENVLAKSMVSRGGLDTRMVLEEKKQIVRKTGLLEFIDTSGSAQVGVGGLGLLRQWLSSRRKGFSSEAKSLGLPAPKGMLLVGVPGCGKSLTAQAVSQEWLLPLLRLDLGKVFSGIVGSSENNIRSALSTCEAVAPCILWLDEIEKGLSGTSSSGQSDGGTTSRVFGTLLTWMQEKKSPVFVVATANDISALPPELLRKGRFDEIFFVDLPTMEERQQIFEIQLTKYAWDLPSDALPLLVSKSDGYSGGEIEQALVAGRYLAFGAGVPFAAEHVVRALEESVPLSQTMRDRIETLRAWAKHRARPASYGTPKPEQGKLPDRTSLIEKSDFSTPQENFAC